MKAINVCIKFQGLYILCSWDSSSIILSVLANCRTFSTIRFVDVLQLKCLFVAINFCIKFTKSKRQVHMNQWEKKTDFSVWLANEALKLVACKKGTSLRWVYKGNFIMLAHHWCVTFTHQPIAIASCLKRIIPEKTGENSKMSNVHKSRKKIIFH